MKFSLVFLLVLGLTGSLNSSPIHTRSLHDDLDDFLGLLPLEEIVPVVQEYLKNDKEVQHVVDYVKSDNFKKLLQEVESIEDVVQFLRYLEESGLDVFELINRLHEAIGLPPLKPVKRVSISGGMAGLVGDIKGLLPLEEIKALYYEKLETSKDFKNLIDRLKSPKLQDLVDKLAANKEVQHIVETLKEHGVNVQAFFDLLAKIFGIKFPEHRIFRSARSLSDDFDDFLGLLPVEEILPVVQEYLENDEEVHHVLEYVKSENFKELLEEVESIEDVVEFLKFLEASGLDVFELINQLHDAIGLPPLNPVKRVSISGGMAGLVGDIKGLLPLEEIKALYYEKLETSKDFKNLVDRLKSPKLQALVDKLAANKEVQHIVETLKEHGINVQAFFDLLAKIFGIKFPEHRIFRSARSLSDDFEDFAALVPIDEIVPIVADYIENDAEVQHVIEYIQSEDFKKLVTEVESIEDVLAFYDYLQSSGLDVYEAVNKLHEVMGLPPLNTPNSLRRPTGGVVGLIEDVKAVLPLEKFEALYNEKMVSSPEFKNLVERLRSPKFQAIIDSLFENEVFLHILETAKGHGIHVDAVADLLSTLLGLKFPNHGQFFSARLLDHDFADFLELIPQEEALEILFQYLDQDKEVQQIAEYVETAEFRELVKVVEDIKDVTNFYAYLQESGLNVYGLVNKIHEYIGLPPLSHKRSVFKITGGVNGLIQDIKAILPVDKIKALYYEKLESSPEFKRLVERLHSPKFQAVINTLYANEEFQEILMFAKAAGIDVGAVADLLARLFGLHFPEHKSFFTARGLEDDLADFVALVPREKALEILFQYLEEDKAVQEVLEYIQSAEFRELVKVVEDIEDVTNFYDYLQESGLDVYEAVNKLHELIGLPPLNHKRSVHRITGGVNGLIQDLKAILPVDEIKALYHEKLETSPEFKRLVERLHSPKFQAVVDTLVANEEFQEILKAAKAAGINVQAVADLLAKLFGLEFPEHKRNIRSVQHNIEADLEDLLDILPIEDIARIGVQYLAEDSDVQNAAGFIRTDEFRDLLVELQKEPEVAEFLEYVLDSGLDIYYFLDLLNDFLGVPHFPKPDSRTLPGEPGVQGMLNAIRAVLPYDEIDALYEEKLVSSPDFKYFIERFKAPEFQSLVDRLTANEKFVELGHQAYLHGIEIRHITEFLAELLGIKFPEVPFPPVDPRSQSALMDDLNEFLDLLPIDQLTKVGLSYLLHDKETQEAIEYARSEDFRNIVRELDRIPEYLEILASLDAAGLDVYHLIQVIHKFIGLDDKHPLLYGAEVVGEPGIAGLIAELKKLLPDQQIKDLYYQKLESSKAFADFIELVKSDNFQTVTNTLFANEDFQNLLHEAQAHGVDLQAISEFFARVFGIATPPGVIDP